MSLYEVLVFVRGENIPVVESMEPISDALVESNREVKAETTGGVSEPISGRLGAGNGSQKPR